MLPRLSLGSSKLDEEISNRIVLAVDVTSVKCVCVCVYRFCAVHNRTELNAKLASLYGPLREKYKLPSSLARN